MFDIDCPEDLDSYESHPGKPLKQHTAAVLRGTQENTDLPIARIAALLHDVGKVNPNFQRKLYEKLGANSYSNHAYLSAITFLALPAEIKQGALGTKSGLQWFSVFALIARHHGHLKNYHRDIDTSETVENTVCLEFQQMISEDAYAELYTFLKNNPQMPLAQMAASLLEQKIDFKVNPIRAPKDLGNPIRLTWQKSLDFFMETQFAFASLINADKRDAGNNPERRRCESISRFMECLEDPKLSPPSPTSSSENTKRLNDVRTVIREEAVRNLQQTLDETDQRVFSLVAPTGSGKTLTLLALARTILNHRNKECESSPALSGVIYCLPFLSITEQVEEVCQNLVHIPSEILLRADSSAHHPEIEKLLALEEKNKEAMGRLLREDFAEQTFDSPFVITTFVQFFETLMSNRNATLLKLPNFGHSVIILDEIQALPPRLYVFFAAYLDAFCRKFNSYVLFSSATMPNFNFVRDETLQLPDFFPNYKPPFELISEAHFQNESFQRYCVEPNWNIESLEALVEAVITESQQNSVMVILNTIKDTRDLYNILKERKGNENLILLNTRFTPEDRRKKIESCKNAFSSPPLVVITTQLVEAGVDIDFPIVFRDLCPFPSLIQSAGRCNRNNTMPEGGRVILFDLKDGKGDSRAKSIYLQDMLKWYLYFTKDEITAPLKEKDLLEYQKAFFDKIGKNLEVGTHTGLQRPEKKNNLILCIRDAAFESLGHFRLIQEQGEQYSIYIPQSHTDTAFEQLRQLSKETLMRAESYSEARSRRLQVEGHLRKMRNHIVQARIKKKELLRYGVEEEPVMGIYCLKEARNYTSEFGLQEAQDAIFC